MNYNKNIFDVVIIGSGVSGLQCANKLSQDGYKVIVVEANNIIGGRTRQDFNFTHYPVEIGGEMIHGGPSTYYYQLCQENNWPIFEVFSMDLFNSPRFTTYFYLGRERKLIRTDQADNDINYLKRVFDDMDELDENNMKNGQLNLLEYLAEKKVSYRVLGLADSVYSKTWGTNLDRIGVKEAIREDSKPLPVMKNFKVHQSSKVLLDYLSRPIQNIKTNWRAKSIEYPSKTSIAGEKLIKVTSYNDEVLECRRVVVTVPIRILKDGDIQFTPKLPERKLKAIEAIGMDGGMKIIAKFSKKFWYNDCQLVLCGDSSIPQIWFDGPPDRQTPPGRNPEYVAVAFITGDQATSLGALSSQNQIRAFLSQLDSMFGTPQNPRPSTDCFVDYLVYDWSKNPYVRGAYSYPSILPKDYNYKESPHFILAEPVDNKIYFAGEASATTYELSTINGALQTGLRAYEELKKDYPLKDSLQFLSKM